VSQWITGTAARQDVHRWRARSSAIVTGIGTVLADDPSLTARPEDFEIALVQPCRVLLDSSLRTPPAAQTLTLPGDVVLFAGADRDSAMAARRRALEVVGARIETVSATPRLDLAAVLTRLAELEINSVWLEAGPGLAGAMIAAGLVDELVFYLAPCLLGNDARGLFELPALERLEQRIRLNIASIRSIGDDLRICARIERR